MPPKRKLPSVPGSGQSQLKFIKDVNNNSATPPSSGPDSDKTPDSTPINQSQRKSELKFQQKWISIYGSWLHYDVDKNVMWCSICRDIKSKSIMSEGTSNFKTTTLQRHVESADHRSALMLPKEREGLDRAVQNADSKEENAIKRCMKVVYWLAKECIPLSKYASLMELLIELEVPNLEHLKVGERVNYQSYNTATDMLKCMSNVINKDLDQRIKQSPVLTILTDESTDIATNHKLCVMARIINTTTMVPYTAFLSNVHISSATGEGIFNSIKDHLSSRGVTISKVSGLGTDGATVMTGQKNGLTGQFLRHNPHLLNTHCSAHRVALCSEQAAGGIPAMKYYQSILESLFYYFKKSPQRCEQVAAVQALLDEPSLKYREVHQIRWLSFYQALDAVYRTLDSLLTYFSSRKNDPKAEGLKKKLSQDFFLYMTYALMDILQPVMKLNLFFQAKDVDISLVKTAVDTCTKDLELLQQGDDPLERPRFQDQLETDLVDGMYKGQHRISVSKYCFIAAKEKFIRALLDNISKRFPDKQLMTSFGIFGLRPVTLLNDDELKEWGNESLEVLIEHFGSPKSHSHHDEKSAKTVTSSSKPVVDPDATREEWLKVKQVVKIQGYPRHSTAEIWGLIRQYHEEDFPNLLTMAALALTHPIHTSDCERAFSKQNLVTSPLRSRISSDHCDELMRVMIEGPSLAEFNYKEALEMWRNTKSRCIFKK
ncbi:hypothetical protein FSP39_011602 [Pinctada imbricata]|uniref:TTF-type domain-containing protein n=1 Tax=Pinctada imbricata TaxID=66713 RepID=A0AA89C9Y4_PINIB|nr:hypothetical protein FSP39_011602 [Pinctada imbricata]